MPNVVKHAARLERWLALLALAVVSACGGAPAERIEDRGSALPRGAASGFFARRAIGDPIDGDERPRMSYVAVDDLDRDGLPDVLVCDALRGRVAWIRQFPRDTYAEVTLADVPAPAHVQPVDFDGDGDRDILVADLGVLMPSNNRVGAVILLENDGRQRFTRRTLSERLARVADVEAGDLDGDGDLDLAVAGFGYDDGETSWLENKGGGRFDQHVLLRLSGPINAVVTDVNGDRHPDIVALVSQEWEEIWAFVNDGKGRFRPTMLWGSTNPDFGSSWISVADMDGDGDPDVVYSNGDAFDYAPANSRPWQGVQWLENRGNLQFAFHRIADLPGASSPQAGDLDGDGDMDVVVVSANNDWDDPASPSVVWLENNGRMQFALHVISSSPTHLMTLALGDLDRDGKPDLVTAGMHISRPYDRMSRVSAWMNRGPSPTR